MHMAAALDAGDIIAQVSTPIGPEETAPELTTRLAQMGGKLLVETVAALENGTASRTPQEESAVTLAPMLSKELSPLDWSKSAKALHDQVRGLLTWPTAAAEIGGVHCKIFSTHPEAGKGAPGTVLEAGKAGLLVACGDSSALRILELQPDGKKRMPVGAFLAGHPLKAGESL